MVFKGFVQPKHIVDYSDDDDDAEPLALRSKLKNQCLCSKSSSLLGLDKKWVNPESDVRIPSDQSSNLNIMEENVVQSSNPLVGSSMRKSIPKPLIRSPVRKSTSKPLIRSPMRKSPSKPWVWMSAMRLPPLTSEGQGKNVVSNSSCSEGSDDDLLVTATSSNRSSRGSDDDDDDEPLVLRKANSDFKRFISPIRPCTSLRKEGSDVHDPNKQSSSDPKEDDIGGGGESLGVRKSKPKELGSVSKNFISSTGRKNQPVKLGNEAQNLDNQRLGAFTGDGELLVLGKLRQRQMASASKNSASSIGVDKRVEKLVSGKDHSLSTLKGKAAQSHQKPFSFKPALETQDVPLFFKPLKTLPQLNNPSSSLLAPNPPHFHSSLLRETSIPVKQHQLKPLEKGRLANGFKDSEDDDISFTEGDGDFHGDMSLSTDVSSWFSKSDSSTSGSLDIRIQKLKEKLDKVRDLSKQSPFNDSKGGSSEKYDDSNEDMPLAAKLHINGGLKRKCEDNSLLPTSTKRHEGETSHHHQSSVKKWKLSFAFPSAKADQSHPNEAKAKDVKANAMEISMNKVFAYKYPRNRDKTFEDPSSSKAQEQQKKLHTELQSSKGSASSSNSYRREGSKQPSTDLHLDTGKYKKELEKQKRENKQLKQQLTCVQKELTCVQESLTCVQTESTQINKVVQRLIELVNHALLTSEPTPGANEDDDGLRQVDGEK